MGSTDANVMHCIKFEIGDTDDEAKEVLKSYGIQPHDIYDRIDIYDCVNAMMTHGQYEAVKADKRVTYIDEW